MLRENRKALVYKRGSVFLAVSAAALIGTGAVAARVQDPAHGRTRVIALKRAPVEARSQPHGRPRATISLYEHTSSPTRLRRQGCSAAKRGVGGIVILDFGQPAYNGHTYGTYLFSGRFAGNTAITQAMYSYAYGYHRCLRGGSNLQITLARGTSNYHPQVPSAYKAGRKWARETRRLDRRLNAHEGLHQHVTSAAADDVEPAWDRSFRRTRDFFRGYRDAHTGHAIYNFGSLDGGVGSVWSARQVFFVTSGMRYAQAIPEIYNHAMARQWAELAHIARHRYHRPMRFAGVMTTHTSRNRGMKPRDARRSLVHELASRLVSNPPDVPAAMTNIRSAE
ncbi:MAG: hypothetical protein QOE43_2582 [Gaiellaceae bacterium]|jgi:hypothetical protein|nr:hypothetical protein [Gaiellaceae bacterium]